MSVLTPFRRLGLALDPAARRITAELQRVSRHITFADRILDIGSGEAPYARFFPHRQYVTADLAARANVRCDAAALPFASRTFDLVLCTEVLEHLPDPDATLEEIRRLLRGRGALVLSTPLTWGVHDARDYHRWTESGLRQLLARHGFSVIELRPRGGILLCFGGLLMVVPWQVFGAAVERRWWQSLLFAATYTLLTPVALFIAALDGIDRRKHFTQGYTAVCYGSARPDQ